MHPRASGLSADAQELAQVGHVLTPRGDGRPCALQLADAPLDPGTQLPDRRCRLSLGGPAWQHDLYPAGGVNVDPHAPRALRAPHAVADLVHVRQGTVRT